MSEGDAALAEQTLNSAAPELGSQEPGISRGAAADAYGAALVEQRREGGRSGEELAARPMPRMHGYIPRRRPRPRPRGPPPIPVIVYGPPIGALFATAAEAEAAGAIMASVSRPSQRPRGRGVALTTPTQALYIHDSGGKMLPFVVTAPGWCLPCSNESLQITVGQKVFHVRTPPSIFAKQAFVAIVPLFPPDVVLTPVLVSEQESVRTVEVQVPKTYGPGMKVKVQMPEGDIRKLQIPAGAFHPDALTYTYNPTAEAEKRARREVRRTLRKDYRCCCQDVDGKCVWYPKSVLKSGPHCPRLQEREGQPRCAKESCGLLGSKGCTKTHHGDGQCSYSMDAEHHFEGGKC